MVGRDAKQIRPLLMVWGAWLTLMAGVNLATHLVVACSVIAVGLLDPRLSLEASVGAVAATLAVVAPACSVWQLRGARAPGFPTLPGRAQRAIGE